MSNKQHVLVIYGGRSAEHEISCRSAAFILRNLDRSRYEVHALAIDKQGRWLPQDVRRLDEKISSSVPVLESAPLPSLPTTPDAVSPEGGLLRLASAAVGSSNSNAPLAKEDLVVFPILHGTFGEDGTIQGLFDLTEVAYVGPDVLGSAVGMDKVVAKKLVQMAGVPVVPWIDTRQAYWAEHSERICRDAEVVLNYPMFVKPARLGSSVGISKVKSREQLRQACEAAFAFDDKILIEKGLEVREIECAVLGGYDPEVSVPGEVIPHADFYSYEAKYIDADGASMAIPAALDAQQARTVRELAKKAFQALDLYGMARVDFFLEKSSNSGWYFNEVNTIPGFTEISQYPLLWKESGIEAPELLNRLIALAVQRRSQRSRLKRSK